MSSGELTGLDLELEQHQSHSKAKKEEIIRMVAWKNYQLETAAFFRKLGLSVIVEKSVEGLRGAHNVDVYVQGDYLGIPFTWIVECKDWKSNILWLWFFLNRENQQLQLHKPYFSRYV